MNKAQYKLPITKTYVIDIICYAAVSGMFADMCNPNNQGAWFSWNKFPDMAKSQCRAQVFLANIKYKNQDVVYEYAEAIGYEIASDMIKRAGYE
jgi:hypothetical protein